MTKTAMVVGSVPPVVTQVLTDGGYRVRFATLTDEPDTAADLAVVHESAGGGTDEEAMQAWLSALREDDVTTLFQTERFTDDTIVRRLLVHQITHWVEGPDPTGAQVAAQVALAEGHPLGVIGTGDLTLGDYYTSETGQGGHDAYEGRRKLSMVSSSLQELVNDINYAVQRMAGTSEGEPWPAPPWDPFEREPSRLDKSKANDWKLKRGNTRPRLSDLYSLPSDQDARLILGATAEALAKARQTHVQATMALIRGESGSGKTLAASLMWKGFAALTEWAGDDHRKMPFVKVNCGGMTAENFDHFMVGSGPGQFTDVSCRVGHFGRADYGVLFLDELGDMDPSAQSRFKPLLDDLIIEPPGLFAYPLHTRVIAATNVDLESADRGFQHDLLRRFNIQLRVPGINERTDSEKLFQIDFVAQLPTVNPREIDGLAVRVIDADVVDALLVHDWAHGNFRELQEVVQGAVTSAQKRKSRRVQMRDLAFAPKSIPGDERVVNVADNTVGEGLKPIRVRHRSDLVRASQLLGQPVYRLPDRSEVVVTDGYRLVVHPTDETPPPAR